MEERIGEAFEFEERLTVVGRQLQVGEVAPTFTLDYFDAASAAMSTVSLADSAGQVRLLNVVNSLDTPVCQVGTHRWQDLSADLSSEVVLYTISMDLPFAQARWNTVEGIRHRALSSHRDEQFGRDYGVLLKEWRLLQRAVFVVDRSDRLVYVQYVADQMQEPDYQAALQAARCAATRSAAA